MKICTFLVLRLTSVFGGMLYCCVFGFFFFFFCLLCVFRSFHHIQCHDWCVLGDANMIKTCKMSVKSSKQLIRPNYFSSRFFWLWKDQIQHKKTLEQMEEEKQNEMKWFRCSFIQLFILSLLFVENTLFGIEFGLIRFSPVILMHRWTDYDCFDLSFSNSLETFELNTRHSWSIHVSIPLNPFWSVWRRRLLGKWHYQNDFGSN